MATAKSREPAKHSLLRQAHKDSFLFGFVLFLSSVLCLTLKRL